MSSELMHHHIAGTAAAMLIITPALRTFFGVAESIYAFFGIMLLIFAVTSKGNWSANSWQLSWCFCLFFLFVYLFAVSFPFTDQRAVLIAGGFLLSSLGIGILCSLYWSEKFFYTVACIVIIGGSVLAVIVVYGYMKTGGDYREFLGQTASQYLTLGSLISLSFCMSLPFVLSSTGKRKLMWFSIILVNGFGLIAVLSRGALLFSGFISLLLLIGYWPRKKSIKVFFYSFISRLIAIIAAVYIVVVFMPARTWLRLQRLFFGDELEVGGRGKLWDEAINKLSEAPLFGHGLGEASVGNMYPHNLFLQVGIDGGFPAIILLMIVVAIPLAFFYKARAQGFFQNDTLPVAFLAAYLWALFEYSKSGDFYKARALFIIASLLIGYLSILHKNRKTVV